MHAVLFCDGWNEPPAQSLHAELPSTSAKLPGLHANGVVEPVAHSWPIVQLEHCSALAKFVALLYVPAGHASGADARSGQYEPASQATKLDAACKGW